MIDHTGIHASQFAASKAFYEKVLATLGYRIVRDLGDAVGFGDGGSGDPAGDFWLSAGTPCTPRCHVAFTAHNAAQVRAFHAAALAAGGRSNGAPGLRPQYDDGYYAAFVLDPDGYNIEAVFHAPAASAANPA